MKYKDIDDDIMVYQKLLKEYPDKKDAILKHIFKKVLNRNKLKNRI
jgi:hypothetical protein